MVWTWIVLIHSPIVFAQESASPASSELKSIAVIEIAPDKKIELRLSEILAAVGTYQNVKVKVLSGVVILTGLVEEEREVEWANSLAQRMDGVVAVQNKLKSIPKEFLDISIAHNELDRLKNIIVQHLPVTVLALSVIVLTFLFFFLTSIGFENFRSRRIGAYIIRRDRYFGFSNRVWSEKYF